MDAQTQLNSTGGSQLSQTQNPQSISDQSLIDQRNDLQTASGTALATPQAAITSVGSVHFDPVKITSTTTITAPAKATNTARPYLVAASIVLACFAVLVFVALSRGEQTKPKHT